MIEFLSKRASESSFIFFVIIIIIDRHVDLKTYANIMIRPSAFAQEKRKKSQFVVIIYVPASNLQHFFFYRSVWRTGGRSFEFIMQIKLSVCLFSISCSSSSQLSSWIPLWLLMLFRRVASVLWLWPFVVWMLSWPLLYVASSIDSTVLPSFVDCVSFEVKLTLLTRFVVCFEKHSEFLLRPNLGKKLFSACSCALISWVLAHVKAFIKDFLKLSLRNAYRIGFMAEFEYPRQPTRMNIVTSNFVRQTSGDELINAIWLT